MGSEWEREGLKSVPSLPKLLDLAAYTPTVANPRPLYTQRTGSLGF